MCKIVSLRLESYKGETGLTDTLLEWLNKTHNVENTNKACFAAYCILGQTNLKLFYRYGLTIFSLVFRTAKTKQC